MILGVTNLKGGVGKTTITQNLAVYFAHQNFKICVVDTDENQNSVEWAGARSEDMPSVVAMGCTVPRTLNKTLEALDKDYDIVLVDGTPNLGEMTTRIMLACDLLLIPILPSGHDFRAMVQFFQRYEQSLEFRDSIPAYFVMNQFDTRINFHQDIKGFLEAYDIPILETKLKKRIAYAQTSVMGLGVYEFQDPKAKAEIAELAGDVMEKAGKHNLLIQNVG